MGTELALTLAKKEENLEIRSDCKNVIDLTKIMREHEITESEPLNEYTHGRPAFRKIKTAFDSLRTHESWLENEISLVWEPGHRGLNGNEEADKAAREAREAGEAKKKAKYTSENDLVIAKKGSEAKKKTNYTSENDLVVAKKG